MTNNLKRAIDTDLSGLRTTQRERAMIFSNVLEGKKVKKKLSTALVLTMVLLLLAAGAVAAVLLSAQELIEQQAVPIANQSEGDSYSVEETNILLKLAQENGITLSDEAKISINKFLSNNQGYYKEELLMALAKAEFGEDPASWTLEEQKWFDDVCVAIGFVSKNQKATPETNEISQEQAVQIAETYIHKHYDTVANLNSDAVYKRGVQYLNGIADGEYNGNYWAIYYQPLSMEAPEYWVYLSSSGDVWDSTVKVGVAEGVDFETVCDRFQQLYGWDYFNWDQEVLQAFKEAINHCAPSNSRMYLSLMKTDYPNIDSKAIKSDQAAALGAQALGLQQYSIESIVYIGSSPNPVWKVCFFVSVSKDNYSYYAVEVDSITGQIQNMEQKNGGYMYHRIVLHSVYEEIERDWKDDSTSVG